MAVTWILSVIGLFVVSSDVHGLSVTTTQNPVGLVNNTLDIVCSVTLTAEQNESLVSITWYRETEKGSFTYKELGVYNVSDTMTTESPTTTLQNISFLTATMDPIESGRIVLSNPDSLSYKITFNSITCEDERRYNCSVIGLSNGQRVNRGDVTDLTVKAKPYFGELSTVELNPPSPVADESLTLTCTGNVGRPAGTFVWTQSVYQAEGTTTIPSTTQTSLSRDGCTYTGSSNITILITEFDNNVIIQCSVLQEAIVDVSSPDYYRTDPFTVLKKPGTPTITKSSNGTTYNEGDNVTLTCAAEGNPSPTFIWRFKETQVGSTAQLQLSNIESRQSGLYVCTATNTINGVPYFMSSNISISVNTTNGSDINNGATSVISTSGILVKTIVLWYVMCFAGGHIQN